MHRKKTGSIFFPAILLLAGLVSFPVFADSIAITNPSFEVASVRAIPTSPSQNDLAPWGWTYSGSGGDHGLLGPDAGPMAEFYATPHPPGLDGTNAFLFFDTKDGQIRQTLSARLKPNTMYTLSAYVGNRKTGGQCGYRLALMTDTGSLVGEWTGANNSISPAGTFTKVSRSFITGEHPPGLDAALCLQISQKSSGPNQYLDVDNISLTATAVPSRATGAPMDVFIVAGQSNAHGWQGDVAHLSATNEHYMALDPHAWLAYMQKNLPEPQYNIGSPGLLAPQESGFGGNFNGCGGELSLGHDLATATGRRICIIKYAVGSAGLDAHFKKTTGYLYPLMLQFIDDSLQQLRAQGFNPTVRGLFWLQGETDTVSKPVALKYGENISQFIHDVRTDLHQPELKCFLTEINASMPFFFNSPKYSVGDVNQGMKSVAGQDPNVVFIPTADLNDHFGDAIHYRADQLITIGQRWAAAYLARQKTK
jgi:hypothetical protein